MELDWLPRGFAKHEVMQRFLQTSNPVTHATHSAVPSRVIPALVQPRAFEDIKAAGLHPLICYASRDPLNELDSSA